MVAGWQDDRILERSWSVHELRDDGVLRSSAFDARRGESGKITVIPAFPQGKHLNPQYSPDGTSLFFISDHDGFCDIYRIELATGALFRVTKLSTGVSGITATSPAMSVAPSTGRMLFSVFEDQGYAVYALDASRTRGEPVSNASVASSAAVLPPGDTPGRATVTNYLRDPLSTEPGDPGGEFSIAAYHSSFSLDAVGQPRAWRDGWWTVRHRRRGWRVRSSSRRPAEAIARSALRRRAGEWHRAGHRRTGAVREPEEPMEHWGASVEHIPYQYAYYLNSQSAGGLYQQDLILPRVFLDQAGISTAYPFSSTRRLEFGAAATRVGYSTQQQSVLYDPFTGQPVQQQVTNLPSFDPVYYASGSIAYVGDNSYSAFTNPIEGSRYRFELAPTVGTLTYNALLADYRKYFFMRPLTFAVRGLHYGRYGPSAEDSTHMYPLFLGEETLMRGYSVGSFDLNECAATSCPVFDRLLGSRLAVFSAELRIPVLGVPEYGLFNFPYLPLTVSPFVDAGDWRGVAGRARTRR